MPLANTPLIEYTLEFLANAGVEDVFLYGGAHSDQLEKYIKYVDDALFSAYAVHRGANSTVL